MHFDLSPWYMTTFSYRLEQELLKHRNAILEYDTAPQRLPCISSLIWRQTHRVVWLKLVFSPVRLRRLIKKHEGEMLPGKSYREKLKRALHLIWAVYKNLFLHKVFRKQIHDSIVPNWKPLCRAGNFQACSLVNGDKIEMWAFGGGDHYR